MVLKDYLKRLISGFQNPLVIPIFGLGLMSWGGGMLSVGYLIGDSNPINTVNAFGLIVSGLGFAITIKSLSVLKKYVEVVRE